MPAAEEETSTAAAGDAGGSARGLGEKPGGLTHRRSHEQQTAGQQGETGHHRSRRRPSKRGTAHRRAVDTVAPLIRQAGTDSSRG